MQRHKRRVSQRPFMRVLRAVKKGSVRVCCRRSADTVTRESVNAAVPRFAVAREMYRRVKMSEAAAERPPARRREPGARRERGASSKRPRANRAVPPTRHARKPLRHDVQDADARLRPTSEPLFLLLAHAHFASAIIRYDARAQQRCPLDAAFLA